MQEVPSNIFYSNDELKALFEKLQTPQHQHPNIQVSDTYKGIKVLGLVADYSACGYYRVINPLTLLKMHGADVKITPYLAFNDMISYDVIIAPRQHNITITNLLIQAIWLGKLVIYELDDDLNHVEADNPAYPVYYPGSMELKGIQSTIRACMGATFSTYELAKWYSQDTVNIAILDNYIDFSLRDWGFDVSWQNGEPIFTDKKVPRPSEYEGKFIIGYSGGNSHYKDFMQMAPQLARVLKEYNDVYFAVNTSPDLVQKWVLEAGIPTEKVIPVDPRHYMDHPQCLRGFDVGIAPVLSNQFNSAKTSLKIKEYMACGAAVVASNIPPYARFHAQNDIKPILVGQNNSDSMKTSWYEALKHLVENRDYTKELGLKGKAQIIKNHSLEQNFHKWPSAWKLIRDRVVQGYSGPPEQVKPVKEYLSYGVVGRNDNCPILKDTKYKKSMYRGAFG
jgi:glycosyltransferase involved in cell wall biosynthesis